MKIISGGQTGADQGGLYGARDVGFHTGGYAPKGFLTEKGCKPELLKGFGLVDSGLDYRGRTELNVVNSDITLWFGDTGTPGYRATSNFALKHKKRFIWMYRMNAFAIPGHFEYIVGIISGCETVNVAGNRESKNPGICESTREMMGKILHQVAFEMLS